MTTEKKAFQPLKEVIDIVGGQTASARICTAATGRKYEQGHVSNWLYRDHKVPSDCAIALVIACREKGHDIKPNNLCPDFAWSLVKINAA